MTLHTTELLPTQKYPFQNIRRMLQLLGMAQGPFGSGDYLVKQRAAGANMSVDVAAGDAWINGTSVANQGIYHQYNDAPVNVGPFTAANPTLPRLDQVILTVNDSSESGSSDIPLFVIVTGTATAGAELGNRLGAVSSASITASHPNWIPLADVLIGASGTTIEAAKIKDTRQKSGIFQLFANTALNNITEHSLPESKLSPGTPSSGQVFGGAGQTAKNAHEPITGLNIETASIVAGQILVVWFSPSINAHENVVSAVLTLDGAETGSIVQNSGSPDANAMPCAIHRFTGLTGKHTLGGMVWATSSAGGTQSGASSIYYEIRNY